MVIELTVLSLLVGVVLGEIGQNKYYEYTTTISRELGQGKGILHEAVVANSKGVTAAVDCTRCYGLLAASAVVIGNFQRPADAFTRTVECARLSMLPSYRRVAFSGCQSAELTSPTTTLYDNGFAFRNLSISKIFVDAYTSMGQIMYDDYCIAVTESIALQTPFTIGASNAYLTASTTISRMTVASQGSSFVSESPALATELILGSDLIQSMKFSCTTPTAYLKLITHTISASLASELVLESEGYDSFLKSSEAIVGVIAGASVCLWLGFLVFFIFWRRSRARHNGNVHPTLEYQTRSVVDSRYGRIKYSNIRRKPLPQTMPVHKTTQRHSQWRALVAMLCGLICGVAFAIGHHFLYYNVNGQPVTNFRTSQTWFLRIGNLLAILVKLSFVVSTGVAFIQLQWMKIHEVALTVKDIDALSGVLSNVLNFFDTSVWWRFPSLLMLALVFW